MIVIKRDGREKGFEFDRIETAVNNAYLEVYGDKVESFVHEIGDILNMIFKDISIYVGKRYFVKTALVYRSWVCKNSIIFNVVCNQELV